MQKQPARCGAVHFRWAEVTRDSPRLAGKVYSSGCKAERSSRSPLPQKGQIWLPAWLPALHAPCG